MRCAAQVHGAARDALAHVRRVVETEANAATDNPMVFADTGEMVSGGNFHGAPVSLAADLLAIAMAHLATISERRSDRLVNPALSGLPPFLTRHGGLESGPDDGAGDGRRADERAQAARPPGLGRHASRHRATRRIT